MPSTIDRIRLVAERDVEERDGFLCALSREPWLGITSLPIDRLAGRFVEIAYRSSFWDEPARPVFRFWRGDRFVDRIGVGAIAGAASWIGRIPSGADRVWVSPTNRVGPFEFALDAVRLRAWPMLVGEGLRWHPRPARSAILTKLIGWGPESDVNLGWAIGSRPLAAYQLWTKTHERAPDLSAFDRPRFDWRGSSPIRVFVRADTTMEDLRRTLTSLQGQIFPNWQATIVGPGSTETDARISSTTLDEAESGIAADADGTLYTVLMAGDTLPPCALAMVAEQSERSREAGSFYGDELTLFGDGKTEPVFKPGWSPRLQGARPYVGRALFVRNLKSWHRRARHDFMASGALPASIDGVRPGGDAYPIRRVLLHRQVKDASTSSVAERIAPGPAVASPPTAAIIVATRDHPALLQRLVASIRARSRAGGFRIIIIDNGSVEAEAKALLEALSKVFEVQVSRHPGPFNFSLICNEAAMAAQEDVLVFLNDDMEVMSDDWLDRLTARAMEPDVGAVGARLTYPDGRLQHVGVLVGMGESAGHFGALAVGDNPGWANRNLSIHEVSAVTGACLAVSREKFWAVGGFDAESLPIELSDIDLCLKLNVRGWQTLVDPAVHLMHEESASRGGATFRRLDRHDRERAIFVERWRHVLRDDPFFHPGLSLYRWEAALG